MNYISQFFGLAALIFMCLSYQKSNKKDFLFNQIIANVFYGLQYLLLGAFSALSTNIISIFRTILFYRYEKNDKKITFPILFVFEILIILFGFLTFKNYFSIIPIFIACIYTYGTWQKNLKLTYFIGILAATLWIYYNFEVGAYIAIIGSIIELISSLVGFIKINIKNKHKK